MSDTKEVFLLSIPGATNKTTDRVARTIEDAFADAETNGEVVVIGAELESIPKDELLAALRDELNKEEMNS